MKSLKVICIFINIGENFESNVKIIEKKKENFRDILIKSSHILATINPRPMNMVPNFSLGTGLSSYLSHFNAVDTECELSERWGMTKTLKCCW